MDRTGQLRAALAQVSPQVQAKWRNAFKAMDTNQSETITPEELECVMKSLNMVPAQGEVEAMIAAVDHNEDHVIDFEEFQMMMIASGRGGGGARLGFSHVVERFIRMSEIAKLITEECSSFVQIFSFTHREVFADLPQGADPLSGEQNPAWFDTFKLFQEQAELTVQNLLLLWGVASQKSFETEFIEAIGDHTELLDNFLRLTDYRPFIQHMQHVQTLAISDMHPGAANRAQTPRPEVRMQQSGNEKRLAELDQRLAALDHERNAILAERRRLVGAEVLPVTTAALKQELEMRRWKEDVGND